MSGWSVVRWTGVLGLAAIVVQVVAVVIGSAAGSAPAIDDATKLLAYVRSSHFAATTVLMLFFIGFALFLGFSAGLRAIAVAATPEHEWLATTTFGAGVVIAVIGFAGLGVGLTALAIAVSNHADAAQVRLLFEVERVLGGAPWLVPAAFYLGAAGSLGLRPGSSRAGWPWWAGSARSLFSSPLSRDTGRAIRQHSGRPMGSSPFWRFCPSGSGRLAPRSSSFGGSEADLRGTRNGWVGFGG